MSDDISMVVSMLECSREDAEKYLAETNGDVLLAIANNMKTPEVSGAKYIPPTPKIDDGLTEEVRTKIQEARKLSEAFSASFRNDLRGAPAQTPAAAASEERPTELTVAELPEVGQDETHQDA